MNVTFRSGEKVNGFTVKNTGLTQFVVENEEIVLCLRSDAGEGRNYSKVLWYTDKKTNRQYRAMRYLYKYVSTVQNISNSLFTKYKECNA